MADDYDKTIFNSAPLTKETVSEVVARKLVDYRGVVKEEMAPRKDVLQQSSTGVKFDAGKVPLELLSPIALEKIAAALQFGAKKYTEHNWRKGMKWSRVAGAAMRHLFAWLRGEDIDAESGLSHLAHLGCCIMFLLEYETTHKSMDDRYKP